MAQLVLPEEYSSQRKVAQERRMQQAIELLQDRKEILVLLHNDPDPDAIASGRALEELIRHFLPDARMTLAHGGIIGRAENRTMAALFTPHVQHIAVASAAEAMPHYDAVLMVDTQPGAGNHLLYGIDYPLDNVILAIDHHPPKRSQVRAVIHDVRPEVGSCSSMLFEYLAVAGVDFSPELATALFYGIKSDTRGLSRHTDELDIWAYSALRNDVNTDLLSRIEHVQLPRSYFRSLTDALANTTIYNCDDPLPLQPLQTTSSPNGEEAQPCRGDVTVSLLFDMKRPDMAAEVADLLLRLEDVAWAVCLGIHDGRLVISVRTDDPDGRAGRLVRSIVGRSGTAGGHDTMAGGRIHLTDATPAERIAQLHALVPRFLRELGVAHAVGVPLLERGKIDQ